MLLFKSNLFFVQALITWKSGLIAALSVLIIVVSLINHKPTEQPSGKEDPIAAFDAIADKYQTKESQQPDAQPINSKPDIVASQIKNEVSAINTDNEIDIQTEFEQKSAQETYSAATNKDLEKDEAVVNAQQIQQRKTELADQEQKSNELEKAQQIEEEKSKLVISTQETNTYSGDRLSLNLQNMEIHSVIAIFATFTGLNIVASNNISGNVTMALDDVPWDEALDIIMKSKGLVKRETGNVTYITTPSEVSQIENIKRNASVNIQTIEVPKDIKEQQALENKQPVLISSKKKIQTVDNLLKEYDKRTVIMAIRKLSHGQITINSNGAIKDYDGRPEPSLVSAQTLAMDIEKLHLKPLDIAQLINNTENEKQQDQIHDALWAPVHKKAKIRADIQSREESLDEIEKSALANPDITDEQYRKLKGEINQQRIELNSAKTINETTQYETK